MKVCATCGRQLDTVDTRCPEDGGALTVVTELHGSSVRVSSGAHAAVAVKAEPGPDDDPELFGDLAVGTKVGEYEIERRIGVGGMGVVYGARHPLIGKRAAIKVLSARLSRDREAVSRFVLEAQAVNQIGHANIVDIFSFGTLPDGRSYFAMEWLQGETLGQRLERGPMPVKDAIAVLSTLCRALEAAHAANVIHRDLKPDNVFLATDDDGWRVKLLDFGIAKLQTASPTVSKTATGIVVGTPLFMAPEQAKGEPVDGRTDVYALGLLAYTIVCGQSLFENETSAIEVLAAHITKTPPSPRLLAPDLPEAFEKLILEMVSKHPSFRPTLVEIRQQLGAIGAGAAGVAGSPLLTPVPGRMTVRAEPVTPLAPTTAPALARPSAITGMTPIGVDDDDALVAPRRSRWPVALAALAALAIGTTVVVALRHSSAATAKPEPDVPAEAVVRAPPPVDAAVAASPIDAAMATVPLPVRLPVPVPAAGKPPVQVAPPPRGPHKRPPADHSATPPSDDVDGVRDPFAPKK